MCRDWITADYLQAAQVVISVLEILVTAFVAIWVVRSVQRKLENDRVLKDFLARELIDLRTDVRTFLKNLIVGNIKAKSVKREHHLLSIRIRDVLAVMNKKYGIDKRFLKVYRQNLLRIVEMDDDYQTKVETEEMVSLSKDTIRELHDLRTNNDHLFDDILLKLYEEK